ncbi:hypothetical protein JCM9803A_03110 [Rhodococcus erythropolis]
MDIIASRSSILIIAQAYYGTTRFNDFAHCTGLAVGVVAVRLRELTHDGLFEKQPYRAPGQRTRYEYLLTAKGMDLVPAIIKLAQWADQYLQESLAASTDDESLIQDGISQPH